MSSQRHQATRGRAYQTQSYLDNFIRWAFANNTRTATAERIAPDAGEIPILPSEGIFMPPLGPGERFTACLFKVSEGREIQHEIIYVHDVVGDVLMAERGQEGTGAHDWPIGTPVSLRVTRDVLGSMQRFAGEVTHCLGDEPPEGWAFMDGRGLKVAEFPALFAKIGNRYGGDGVATFRLPNRLAVGDVPKPIICLR